MGREWGTSYELGGSVTCGATRLVRREKELNAQ